MSWHNHLFHKARENGNHFCDFDSKGSPDDRRNETAAKPKQRLHRYTAVSAMLLFPRGRSGLWKLKIFNFQSGRLSFARAGEALKDRRKLSTSKAN